MDGREARRARGLGSLLLGFWREREGEGSGCAESNGVARVGLQIKRGNSVFDPLVSGSASMNRIRSRCIY
jgi:hypothetical protein